MAIQINGKKVIQLGTANIPVLKGEKGDIGQQGEQGIQGIPGYTPVKGVDYMTSEDRQQIADTVKADITPEITELKNGKVNKKEGYGLSQNDFTNELKEKLDNAGKQEDIDKLKAENQEQAEQINYLDKTLTRAEASGENINIKNSAEYPISNISIDTNIKQDSREGYNKFDFINSKMNINNGGTLNKDLENNLYKFTPSSATQWQGFYYTIPQNFEAGKVYLSFKVKGDSTTNVRAGVTGVLTNYKDITVTSSYTQYNLNFTLAEAGTVTINFYNWNTSDVIPFYIQDIQVTINESKPYEQYGSMPSIEFPSEIKTPVGKQEVVVGNKNLLPSKAVSKTINGMEFKVNEDGSITLNGTTDNVAEFEINGMYNNAGSTKFSLLKNNYVSYLGYGLSGLMLNIFDTTRKMLSQLNGFSYKKFTLDKQTDIGAVYLYIKAGITLSNVTVYPMIVQGDEMPTDYIEHQSQVQDLDLTSELLGTIVDKEDGSYFENRYKRLRLTSNLNWKVANNVMYSDVIQDYKIGIINIVYSNMFKGRNNTNSSTNLGENECCFYLDHTVYRFYCKSSIIDVNEWKTYLDNNVVEIVYELETPTYTKLTDEQQAQWNKIKKMHTYEGVTNIYTINENGISPILNLKYVKSPKVVEENLQAQIDKLKNSIISMGGNV